MELDALVFLVIGLVVGAAAYGFLRGQKLTPVEIAKLAEMAAMSAEQYARDGVLRSNDEQLRFALDFMKSRLPMLQGLDTNDMVKMIKSFVPAASALTAQINATKAAGVSTQPNATPPQPRVGRMGL